MIIVVNDKQPQNPKPSNLLSKYLKYENQATTAIQSTRVSKTTKKMDQKSPQKFNDWYIAGKEDKLNSLQDMPIKKFIVGEVEGSYRPKDVEEEKKLPLSDEKGDKEPMSTTKIANQFYRVGKVLGKGAFGKVNLAIHRETGDLVAMKSLNKQYLSDHNSQQKVMQEVAILKMTKHPNII